MNNINDPKEKKNDPEKVTNDPEEVIDKPEEVQESNDEKIDQDFPGYPHYPAKDDILNARGMERMDINMEEVSRSHAMSDDYLRNISGQRDNTEADAIIADEAAPLDIGQQPNDADITEEDLLLIGERDQDMDDGEDEELRNRGWTAVTGRDLDLPTDDLQDDLTGNEDEENDYFSLGGDEKESLEESNDQNNL